MLLNIFFKILYSMLISLGLCLIGVLLTWKIQNAEIAKQLLFTWIIDFNGIFVGGTTLGLSLFLYQEGRSILQKFCNIVSIDVESFSPIVHQNYKLSLNFHFIVKILIIGFIGSISLELCNFQLNGFAGLWMRLSMIIYFLAAFIFIFFIETLTLIKIIEEHSGQMNFKKNISSLDISIFNSYFLITATLGITAAFLGFRGTLTAFSHTEEKLHEILLSIPVFIFFPVGLIYSFYPRYVLNKIEKKETLKQIDNLSAQLIETETYSMYNIKDQIELKVNIANLKEKLQKEIAGNKIFSIKDSPALIMGLIMIFQFIYKNDSVIKTFITKLLSTK